MIDLRHPEQTFLMFFAQGTPVGIPSTAVEQILAETRPAGVTREPLAGSGPAVTSQARLLVLRGRDGARSPPLRVSGELQMLTLPASQVTELPCPCAAPDTPIMGVALTEEKILFLIMDPHRLASLAGWAGSVPDTRDKPSAQELG